MELNAKLNKISGQIKEIEIFLKQKNIFICHRFKLDDEYAFSWDQYNTHKRRLLLVGPDFTRPFIECNTFLRCSYFDKLPDFLDSILSKFNDFNKDLEFEKTFNAIDEKLLTLRNRL